MRSSSQLHRGGWLLAHAQAELAGPPPFAALEHHLLVQAETSRVEEDLDAEATVSGSR